MMLLLLPPWLLRGSAVCWNSNRAINPTEECVDACARIILIKERGLHSQRTSALLRYSRCRARCFRTCDLLGPLITAGEPES